MRKADSTIEELSKDIYSRLKTISPTAVLTQRQVWLLLRDQWNNAALQAKDLREIDVGGLGTWKVSARRACARYLKLLAAKEKIPSTQNNYEGKMAIIEHRLEAYKKIKDYEFLKRYLERKGVYIGGDKESDFPNRESRGSSTEEVKDL